MDSLAAGLGLSYIWPLKKAAQRMHYTYLLCLEGQIARGERLLSIEVALNAIRSV